MATLFQIRRGSGSVSLVDGEIYLHKGLSSLQVSLGTTPITLARLTDINYGSIYLQGDVTASNAYFSGDVSISGNLFLGNNTGDNISVPGVFTTNLVPGGNGTLDLGTSGAKWKTVYANSVTASLSGSVNGVDITVLNQRATSLETTSASLETRATALATITGSLISSASSFENRNTSLSTITGSLISSASSFQSRFATLQTTTASYNSRFDAIGVISGSLIQTASLNTVAIANLNLETASLESRAVSLATLTGSLISSASADRVSVTNLNSYTASLNQAIQLTGSTVSFLGDIIVYGTQSIIHSTNLAVDDNIIYLNSTSSTTNIDFGIVGHYNDGTYRHGGVFRSATDGAWRVFKGYQPEISGAVNLSEATFQLADFKANDISSSTIVGIGNVTTYSASVDSRLTNLQSKSASVDNSVSLLGQYTQSHDTKNATLQTYTASVNSDLTIIHQTTASLNLFSASVSSSLSLIYQTTGSLNLFSASVSSSLSSIYVTTGSLVATASSHETRFASLATISGSLISSASSFETRFASLATISGSLIQTASLNTIAISNLNLETASLETRFATLGLTTGSLISATASLYLSSSDHERRLDELEYTTSVNLGNGAHVQLAAINLFTGSANTRLEALEAYSASYAQYFTYSGSKFHIDFNV
jgi:hypothetical protein